MRINKSVGAGWIGRYLVTSSGKQIARIVLDPGIGRFHPNRPDLSIALPVGRYMSCAAGWQIKLWEIRLRMPALQYRHSMGRLYGLAYRASCRFWHSLDQRPR